MTARDCCKTRTEDNKASKKICKLDFLKCMYTNARSMKNNNKREELYMKMCEDNIDVMGITESWGHEDISDGN